MTKSKIVIFSTLIIAIAVTFAVIINNAFNSDRTYTILTLDQFGVCFMVNSELEYIITPNGFKYSGGKNFGEFTLSRDGLISESNKVTINNFKAAYTKEKNLRTYQYLLDDTKTVFTDKFVFVKKSPLNLVPYRSECKKIKKNYPNHLALKPALLNE